MATVSSRELRNRTRQVLERVDAGEVVTIAGAGRPVARIVPESPASRWNARDTLFEHLGKIRADSGLEDDLQALALDSTDDLSAP